MTEVKAKRRYDASKRREQADQTRRAVLDVARRQFLDNGYAPTSVASIAEGAGVSPETVYKAFGGKSGVIRALWQHSLEGVGPVPASIRSDAMSDSETDPERVLRAWGAFTAEVAPQGAPVMLLIRAAAATDPEMAALRDEASEQRRARMRHNARKLQRRGWLRPGVSLTRATDILWAYSSEDLYDLLVIRSGWPPAAYGRFVGDALVASLAP